MACELQGEGIQGPLAEPGTSGFAVAGGQPAGGGHVASSNTKAREAENQGGASTTPTWKSRDLGLLLCCMDDFALLPL